MNNKKNSNRGGALLSVVIVMAIVGILGALAISIAYTNFTMKVVDKKSKDNFYSTEKILEEICVGLQEEASKQYEIAYTEVMSNYNQNKTVTEMETEYNNAFVVNMVTALQVSNNSKYYEIGQKADPTSAKEAEGLYRFVKNEYDLKDASDENNERYINYYSINSDENRMDTLSDGLALRNVNVTYQEGNYFNSITTDILISTPEVRFSKISAMPEISEYSYIAEGGISLTDSVDVELKGKAYSGKNAQGVSIELAEAAKFDATDDKTVLLVAKGDVLLKGNAHFTTGDKTALWANSISTLAAEKKTDANGIKVFSNTSNVIDLNGRAYINDDITVNGRQDTIKLTGQYYGFSNNDSDASESSSIIINGKETNLDLSGLDTLVVAGTSFVSTKNMQYTVNNKTYKTEHNVLMGDSIAIKSNQLVYLLPTECNGIENNPMTHAQYEALPKDWKQTALKTELSSIGKKLEFYEGIDIEPVFEPNVNDGGTVYLYLSFDDSKVASKYFMDYYKMNSRTVNQYLNAYLKAFEFDSEESNTLTRIVTQGNYLVEGEVNNKPQPQYSESTGDAALSVQEFTNYESSFKALYTKLITNESAIKDTEINKTVFVNLVDTGNIGNFFEMLKGNNIVLENGKFDLSQTQNGSNVAVITKGDKKAIIVDGSYEVGTSSIDQGAPKGLIIATGDVTLSGDWEGLIICGGKLIMNGTSSKLVHNPDYIGTVMLMECNIGVDDEDATTPLQIIDESKIMKFFKSGSDYSIGSSETNQGKADVRNCISYENYKSE